MSRKVGSDVGERGQSGCQHTSETAVQRANPKKDSGHFLSSLGGGGGGGGRGSVQHWGQILQMKVCCSNFDPAQD